MGLLSKITKDPIAKFNGWYGEVLTEKELMIVKLFGRDGKILHNVYLPKDNGETSEIDVLFITQKGIFVIESKNYSGWIFGDEKDQYWTAMLPNKEKNRFYNPIKQNRTHCKWLSSITKNQAPLFSLIVFSERCALKNIKVYSDNVVVIQRDETYKAIKRFWNNLPDVLSPEQVLEIYNGLRLFTNVDAAVKETHINNIKSHQNQVAATSGKEPSEVKKICPKCGSNLLIRTASRGTNAGNQFYGCSNYPRCRYIENMTSK